MDVDALLTRQAQLPPTSTEPRTVEPRRASNGVTEAALKRQKAGLMRCARGCITVFDRPAFEERTCKCYAVVKTEYDRLLRKKLAR